MCVIIRILYNNENEKKILECVQRHVDIVQAQIRTWYKKPLGMGFEKMKEFQKYLGLIHRVHHL